MPLPPQAYTHLIILVQRMRAVRPLHASSLLTAVLNCSL